jgi:hypothetical protein
MNDTTHTDIVEIDPPKQPTSRGSRSKWKARLDEARSKQGRWMMVTQPMTKATAAQVASDLRRSHVRDPKSMRLSGVNLGDRWETTFGLHPIEPVVGEFHVWIRWVGSDEEFAW